MSTNVPPPPELPPRQRLPVATSAPREEHQDRLTIGRLLVLTAGVAVGLALFAPHLGADNITDTEDWRGIANALVIGLALPAPLFCLPRVFRNRSLGAGGLFALAAGLGVLLLVPPAIVEWAARNSPASTNDNFSAAACLFYSIPLMGLWYLLAAIVSGHAGRRLFEPATPWIERYGFGLAVAWSPLGVWLLVDVYAGVFS